MCEMLKWKKGGVVQESKDVRLAHVCIERRLKPGVFGGNCVYYITSTIFTGMHDECPLSSRVQQVLKQELCWYGNKNISGGGRGVRQGDEERWTKKSREMGKAEVRSLGFKQKCLSWPPSPCLTLALVHSLAYYLTLALSSSVFLQSLQLLPWILFTSYSYSCPLYTRQCVCVCVCVVADSILRYLKVSSVHHFCHRTPLLQR